MNWNNFISLNWCNLLDETVLDLGFLDVQISLIPKLYCCEQWWIFDAESESQRTSWTEYSQWCNFGKLKVEESLEALLENVTSRTIDFGHKELDAIVSNLIWSLKNIKSISGDDYINNWRDIRSSSLGIV